MAAGSPVGGAMPSTAARFTAAWPRTSVVIPAASRLPNRSRHCQRDAEAGPRTRRKRRSPGSARAGRAPRPRPRRSVRVRLRRVDLLDALPEPLAGDAARAHADDRLDVLEARPLGVLPRVEKLKTRSRRYGSIQIASSPAPTANAEARAKSRSGIPETRRIPATIRKREMVVPGRLHHDQPAEDDDDDPNGIHQLAHRGRHRTPREHRADPEAHRELAISAGWTLTGP